MKKAFLLAGLWSLAVWIIPLHSFRLQTIFGLGCFSLYMAHILSKRFHPVVGISFFYFSFHSIIRFIFPQFFWSDFELSEVVGFESLVSEAYIYMLSFAVLFLFVRKKDFIFLEYLFIGFAAIDAAVLLFKCLRPYDAGDLAQTPWFLFNNSAIDSSFIACCLPFVHKHLSKRFFRLSYFAIISLFIAPCILTKTASGVLGIGLFLSFTFWNSYQRSIKDLPAMISVGGIVAWIGYFLQSDALFDGSGRFAIWKLALSYWRQYHMMVGTGLGTFQMYGPALQLAEIAAAGKGGSPVAGFTWLHNDLLQILFESGLIGLLLAMAVFAITARRAWRDPTVFTSLMIFVSLSFIQMPLRWFVFTLLGAFLVAHSLNTSEKYNA